MLGFVSETEFLPELKEESLGPHQKSLLKISPVDGASKVDFSPETIEMEGVSWVVLEPIVPVVHEPGLITAGKVTRVMEQAKPAIEPEEEDVKSQEQVGSVEETSVHSKANGFDEALGKTTGSGDGCGW